MAKADKATAVAEITEQFKSSTATLVTEYRGLSVANLAEVQPTIWFNVPRGFDMALPLLEADLALAKRVFERLRVVFYAGADVSVCESSAAR